MANDAQKTSVHLMRLSRTALHVTGRTALELSALHEWLALMPAAVKGLGSREHQLLTLQALEGDLEGRRRAVQELEFAGGSGGQGAHKLLFLKAGVGQKQGYCRRESLSLRVP